MERRASARRASGSERREYGDQHPFIHHDADHRRPHTDHSGPDDDCCSADWRDRRNTARCQFGLYAKWTSRRSQHHRVRCRLALGVQYSPLSPIDSLIGDPQPSGTGYFKHYVSTQMRMLPSEVSEQTVHSNENVTEDGRWSASFLSFNPLRSARSARTPKAAPIPRESHAVVVADSSRHRAYPTGRVSSRPCRPPLSVADRVSWPHPICASPDLSVVPLPRDVRPVRRGCSRPTVARRGD